MRIKNYLSILAISIVIILPACKQKESKDLGKEEVENYYSEKYRPQFHFSPEANWMNDPNGMVYYEGEYHLFYQYYPDSTVWGPMHWGHAISTDLVHWEHLPIALYPDSLGYIFSGSAVVDWNNASGFGTDENPPLIAIYTYHNPDIAKAGGTDVESQAIAYSLDKGRSWIKYDENPVIPNDGNRDFRDPNVIWNEDIQKWNLLLSAHDHVQIYSSDNLKEWQYESDFGIDAGGHGGVWECPDLFPLQVEGTDNTKWVLIVNINPGGPNGGSATQYFVGDFDGHKFIADSKKTSWIDYGRDNYAGVTWSDIPKEDGRRIFLGWMSNWDYANVVPTEKWRSAMTIPRKLNLQKANDGFVLASFPVDELKNIRTDEFEIPAQDISERVEINTRSVQLNRSEMDFTFQLNSNSLSGATEEFGLALSNNKGEIFEIKYSPETQTFYIDRTKAGLNSFSDKFASKSIANYKAGDNMEIRVFVDEASIEVFVDGGKLVMTEIVFPSEPYSTLEMFSTNGAIKLSSGKLWSLNSVWE
ncbi:glycoside hydrolase family 32 protein [Prolixibacteraceae bacterium Z1-6]|uniref:Glycoside hydrolase family 32 protein n=1 Tax=Draconibacterium aestuarii TaxID=2998507 RepID=A0A9X3J6K7_9BACT|nr:glycoside hydrolase family 32 protein [Prolixibacteraceae bacterium Z1-6]